MRTFFELLQIAVKTRTVLSRNLSISEWQEVYAEAKRHCLVGITFQAVAQLPPEMRPPKVLFLKWLGEDLKIRERNELIVRRTIEVQNRLKESGLRTCVMKGQALQSVYGESLVRSRLSSDIDILVDSDIESIVQFVEPLGKWYHATMLHVECRLFQDVDVEIHAVPIVLRCPWLNKRLQHWFKSHNQYLSVSTPIGKIDVPSVEYNVVYLLVHIFHHLLYEGVGYRQLVDYCMTLKSYSRENCDKTNVIELLSHLELTRFTRGVMYIMQQVFMLEDSCLLLPPDPKIGQMLMTEFSLSGDLGHSDNRDKSVKSRNALVRVWSGAIRNLRFFRLGPSVVLCGPLWRLWHYQWMRRHGYRSSQMNKKELWNTIK